MNLQLSATPIQVRDRAAGCLCAADGVGGATAVGAVVVGYELSGIGYEIVVASEHTATVVRFADCHNAVCLTEHPPVSRLVAYGVEAALTRARNCSREP